MHKKLLAICLVTIFLAVAFVPTGFAGSSDQVVVTYGETTYMNPEYKSIVDDYFSNKANVDIDSVESKVITAGDVNEISSGFSGRTYNSNQIISCALLDLNQNGEITVEVDNSISTITPKMYMSALKSAGIQGGHVYVTSPVSATGESALAGIMDCYEEATDVEIPETVKEAASQEISTEAEILNNSNVSADDLSNMVDDVKEKVSEDNITDHDTVVNIIYDYSTNYNINISDSDVEKLADTIVQIQLAQDDANAYQEEVSGFIDNASSESGFSLDGLFNSLFDIFNISY